MNQADRLGVTRRTEALDLGGRHRVIPTRIDHRTTLRAGVIRESGVCMDDPITIDEIGVGAIPTVKDRLSWRLPLKV